MTLKFPKQWKVPEEWINYYNSIENIFERCDLTLQEKKMIVDLFLGFISDYFAGYDVEAKMWLEDNAEKLLIGEK